MYSDTKITQGHLGNARIVLILCLLLELGACILLTPCSPQSQAQELRTTQFRHHVTALSHSYRECLRRSLGSSSFPPPSPFSSLRRPAWRFWQFFCFLPFWHCCLFGIVAFLALLPFGSPPPPAACSARPAGVAIKHLPSALSPQEAQWRHGDAGPISTSIEPLLDGLAHIRFQLYRNLH